MPENNAKPDNQTQEQINVQAFKEAVIKHSENPVIFVDPQSYSDGDSATRAQKFSQQMENQVPGATEAFIKRFGLDPSDPSKLEAISAKYQDESPSAVSNVMIGGQEYCVVNMPNKNWDTNAEIIEEMTGYSIEQFKSVPQNETSLNVGVGTHEADHCNSDSPANNAKQRQGKEASADRLTISDYKANGSGDTALFWKDMRSLGAGNGSSAIHSTGPLLHEDLDGTDHHILLSTGYRKGIDQMVNKDFDWVDYEGSAMNAQELLQEDPDAYFEFVNDQFEDGKNKLDNELRENPSHDIVGTAIAAQTIINYAENFEDAYRRRILGEDVPERTPTQIIPQDRIDQYYMDQEKLEQAEKLGEQEIQTEIDGSSPQTKQPEVPEGSSPSQTDDKGYQKGLDGITYQTQVEGLTSGQVEVCYNKGVNVDGVGAQQLFSETANPDPNNVSMVHPTQSTDIDPVIASNTSTLQNNNTTAQSLG